MLPYEYMKIYEIRIIIVNCTCTLVIFMLTELKQNTLRPKKNKATLLHAPNEHHDCNLGDRQSISLGEIVPKPKRCLGSLCG